METQYRKVVGANKNTNLICKVHELLFSITIIFIDIATIIIIANIITIIIQSCNRC